ncbi:MAG: substrate-binding domain-containing protein [Bacteroidetes Order II. Incertae sedis bacterium]|nr:substrate-binding domain-containing protein [Bacteroidetes Order II. bacterium]
MREDRSEMPSTGWQILSGLILVLIIGGLSFLAWRYLPGWMNKDKTEAVTSPATSPVPTVPANATAVRIHGSNTLAARLVPELVRAFLKQQGASDVTEIRNDQQLTFRATLNGEAVAVTVKPTGSHQGFVDAQNKQADVVMASRPVADNEAADLKNAGLGDLRSNRVENVVAMDGVAVIVNSNTRIKELSKAQVAGIFKGEITNWAEVGYPAGNINLYVRDAGATVDLFKSEIYGSEEEAISPNARSFRDNEALIQSVAEDEYGIGFTSWAATKGNAEVKSVALYTDATQPVMPNPSTIATEEYQLSRRLYLYTPKSSEGKKQVLIDRFMAYIQTSKGQEAAQRAGFVPLDPQGVNNFTTTISDKYRAAVRGGVRTNVVLRFKTGSSELDSKAVRDLERLKTDPRYAGKQFVLIGFTDNVGGEPSNVALSLKRAQSVQALMQQGGLSVASVTGLGSSDPVRENTNELYRAMNRRVDVWYR